MVIARDTAQRSYSNDRMNATESRQAATRSDQGAARAEGLRSEDSYGWSKSNAGRRMDPNRMDGRGRRRGRWWSGDKEQTENGGRSERQKQIEKQGCKDAKARRTSVKRSVSQLRIEQEIR